MELLTRILQRNFSEPLATPPLTYAVNSYSHHAIGGPLQASITAYGNANALWELIEMLRAPVEILDAVARYCWWGYVAEVQVRVDAIEVGVSLDSMANKVAVAYSLVEPGSQTVGQRATTTWAQNADSVAEYGIKEMLVSLGGATATQAEGLRDTVLAQRKYPIPTVQPSSAKGSLSATLSCRGWWDTLKWRYYANSGANSVATTTQIANIIASVGAFLAGTTIDNASGITSSEYRDGDTTALEEIEKLLASGTTNNRRLLARVTPKRQVVVYEEPVSGDQDSLMLSDGSVQTFIGSAIEPHICPAAFWARLKDVIPGTADVSKLADPSMFFVEEVEFNAQQQTLKLSPRSAPSPWELGQLIR